MKRLLAGALLTAVAFPMSACGDDNDSRDPGVVTAEAPDVGQPSGQFGVPMPKGATPDPPSAPPGGEAYKAPVDATLADLNAFYEQQTDNKPFKDYQWCGGAAFSSDHIVRIWTKPDTGQLIVELHSGEPSVVISVRQDPAQPASCPPGAPAEPSAEDPNLGGNSGDGSG